MDRSDSDDKDEVLTLGEYFQNEEEEANEVSGLLSASDSKNCSYDQGYVGRQAIFVCSTCTRANPEEPGGICLACSLKCHDTHDLLVLYTKRNFRCDCGNSRFKAGSECKLQKVKSPTNTENIYGQNFKGLYCTCHRPYPDPDDDVEDEMIQCCVCEDWYHARHLEPPLETSSEEFSEMICQQCVERFPFLKALEPVIDVEATHDPASKSGDTKEEEDMPPAKRARTIEFCLSKTNKREGKATRILFEDEAWREKLCKCTECKELLQQSKLEFLLDPEDSIAGYEAKGKARTEAEENDMSQQISNLWNNLDRISQIEFVNQVSDFREQLREFLLSMQKDNKVVTKEAVCDFFRSFRMKTTTTSIPKTCTE